jgi:predicted metal-dependent hydrolase
MDRHQFGSEGIRYIVRKSPDSKYVQLKFRPNLELEVTVPSERKVDVKKVLWKKRHWINRKYEEIASSRRVFDGKQVLYKGIPYEVTFTPRTKMPKVSHGRIVIPLQKEETTKEALERWMSSETKRYVCRRLNNYRQTFKLHLNGFSVKDTRRWAYCLKDHHLVFNWRLIALPTELADYVVLHEISHFREFNHSRSFRYALASVCPDFEEKETSLKSYLVD